MPPQRAGPRKTTVGSDEQPTAQAALQLSQLVLDITNRHPLRRPALRKIVAAIQDFTQCQAVGIRILDGAGNIPYQAYTGFSRSFYERESPLSIRADRCMCIYVIQGKTDATLPFFTPGGSFYMNGTTKFLANVSDNEKGQTRNVCNEMGFESVALIPIRSDEGILGLIHIADPHEDCVPLALVEVLERIAMQLAVAARRALAEDALEQSREALQLERDKLRAVIENARIGISIASPNGTILSMNAEGLRIHGVAREADLLARMDRYPEDFDLQYPDGRVMPAEDWPANRAVRGDYVQDYEVMLVRRNSGEQRLVSYTAVPIRDRRGRVVLHVFNMVDLTDQRRAQQQAEQREAELLHVSRLCTLGEMASGFAHELNQPLTAIMSFASASLRTMRSEPRDAGKLASSLEQIVTQSARAGEIIRRVRALAQRRQPCLTPTDMNKVVRDTLGLLGSDLRHRQIDVVLDLSRDLPPVMADPIQLEQALLNLVRNAGEAMETIPASRRRVTIRTSSPARKTVQVAVSDTGPGIPAEMLPRIFDPFFTTKEKGLGIGLPITRSLVELHRGHLEVDSNPGCGCTFAFTVPTARSPGD